MAFYGAFRRSTLRKELRNTHEREFWQSRRQGIEMVDVGLFLPHRVRTRMKEHRFTVRTCWTESLVVADSALRSHLGILGEEG